MLSPAKADPSWARLGLFSFWKLCNTYFILMVINEATILLFTNTNIILNKSPNLHQSKLEGISVEKIISLKMIF